MLAAQVRGAAPGTEEVRLRLTLWQRVVPYSAIFVVIVGQILAWIVEPQSALTPSERHEMAMSHDVIFCVCAMLMLIATWLSGRFGVVLTPTEAHVYGLRRRVIRWSDVRAVDVETVFGTRLVVLHEANGYTRLRAPRSGFLSLDRGFEEKYDIIERWWLTHREPTDSTPWEG